MLRGVKTRQWPNDDRHPTWSFDWAPCRRAEQRGAGNRPKEETQLSSLLFELWWYSAVQV